MDEAWNQRGRNQKGQRPQAERAERADVPVAQPAPLVWRYPTWIPVAALLLACVGAAWAVYRNPATGFRFILLGVAVALLVLGVFTARMAFVVDTEGLAVRLLGSEVEIAWSDVKGIGIADVRGNETIRIVRSDDSTVDVPPSLLQPVRPTSKPNAAGRLRGIMRQVVALRPH